MPPSNCHIAIKGCLLTHQEDDKQRNTGGGGWGIENRMTKWCEIAFLLVRLRFVLKMVFYLYLIVICCLKKYIFFEWNFN